MVIKEEDGMVRLKRYAHVRPSSTSHWLQRMSQLMSVQDADEPKTLPTCSHFSARQHNICTARYMISPSVRLSVRHMGGSDKKTIEVRIMRFSPYNSTIPQDFAG